MKQKVTKQFLQPDFVNIYNFDMNSIDIADYLLSWRRIEAEEVVVFHILVGS